MGTRGCGLVGAQPYASAGPHASIGARRTLSTPRPPADTTNERSSDWDDPATARGSYGRSHGTSPPASAAGGRRGIGAAGVRHRAVARRLAAPGLADEQEKGWDS